MRPPSPLLWPALAERVFVRRRLRDVTGVACSTQSREAPRPARPRHRENSSGCVLFGVVVPIGVVQLVVFTEHVAMKQELRAQLLCSKLLKPVLDLVGCGRVRISVVHG